MRNKRSRLDPVIHIAETRQKEAARQLAHMMEYQAVLQQQIEQLQTYRDDYKRKQLLGNTLHTTTLYDRQLFLGRLNGNIKDVENQLKTVEKNLLARMDYWKKTRARTQALDKVMTRFKNQENKLLDRRMQKEQDELAARQSPDNK